MPRNFKDPIVICECCGTSHQRVSHQQKFCSACKAMGKCYKLVCPVCTSEFMGRKNQTYCSNHCSDTRHYTKIDGVEFKICNTCKILKPMADYVKDKGVCKLCKNLASRNDRQVNPEKWKSYFRKSHVKHCVKRREQARQWRIQNRERRYAYTQLPHVKQSAKLACRDWQKRHLDYAAEHAAAYRCKKRKVTVGEVSRTEVLKRDQNTCYICGCKCYGRNCHLDHINPVSRGGSHTVSNLAVACMTCNIRKKDKTLAEFELKYGPVFRRPI